MKHFNRRAITAALLITLGAAFSVNADAAETSSIENSLTEMVIEQGQQVVSDLSVQLQQTIEEELSSFSIDFSFDEEFLLAFLVIYWGVLAPATTSSPCQYIKLQRVALSPDD